MRRKWNGLLCLLFLIAMIGCRSPETYLRPPKQPEAFNTVPLGTDPRYQNPPEYPKEAMNKGKDKNKDKDKDKDATTGGFSGPGKQGGFTGPGFSQ
jgi:hypothetical protein